MPDIETPTEENVDLPPIEELDEEETDDFDEDVPGEPPADED